MKRIILGITLVLAASVALAGNNGPGTPTCQGSTCTPSGTTGGTSTATATVGDIRNTNTNVNANTAIGGNATVKTYNDIRNTNAQQQGQLQGQMQGQGQTQKATGGNASNKGVTATNAVTFNEAKQRLQAPGVAVAATTTTASCRVAVNGGVSFPGGAVGFGSAFKDEKCDKRALGLALIDAARVAQGIGAPEEVYGPLFMEGIAYIRASGNADEPMVRVDETPAQPVGLLTDVSYTQ